NRVGSAGLPRRGVIDPLDREASRIQDQLFSCNPVVTNLGRAVQYLSGKIEFQIEVEVPDPSAIRTGERVDVHAFMIEFVCPILLVPSWGTRKITAYAEAGTEESPRCCERSVFLGQDQRSRQAQWIGAGICER